MSFYNSQNGDFNQDYNHDDNHNSDNNLTTSISESQYSGLMGYRDHNIGTYTSVSGCDDIRIISNDKERNHSIGRINDENRRCDEFRRDLTDDIYVSNDYSNGHVIIDKNGYYSQSRDRNDYSAINNMINNDKDVKDTNNDYSHYHESNFNDSHTENDSAYINQFGETNNNRIDTINQKLSDDNNCQDSRNNVSGNLRPDNIRRLDDNQNLYNLDNTSPSPDQSIQDQQSNEEKPDLSLKFFVGGIPPDCWEDDVIRHFSQFGEVKEVQVMRDTGNGRNRGFCFVTMQNKNTHDAIFSAEHKINNKKVDVREMQTQNLNRKIFVGGINVIFDEENIKEYFSKFGEVEKVTIMRDPEDKRSRGFGFVVFCNESSVKEVLKTTLHQINNEYKVEVRAAEARPKTFRNSANYFLMYNQWGGGRGMASAYGLNCGYNGYGAANVAYNAGYYVSPQATHIVGGNPINGGVNPVAAYSPYAASLHNPSLYNYGVSSYGPQRTTPITPRGRSGYRMGGPY